MHNLNSFLKELADMDIDPKGTLLVHSSMKAIGEVEGGPDTVIDALIEYMRPGLLVLPSHTWETITPENPVYDPASSPCCVGLLPNLFLKRPGVIRSWHPTHSVAAIGPDAQEFCSGEEFFDTPCSRGGCYGKLYDRSASILFLGCSLKSNTLLHGVEEWNSIPSRLTEHRQLLLIRKPDNSVLERPLHLHSAEFGDVSKNYDKVEGLLKTLGIARYGRFGDATCTLCDSRGMVDAVTLLLRQNPDLFSNTASPDQEDPEHKSTSDL